MNWLQILANIATIVGATLVLVSSTIATVKVVRDFLKKRPIRRPHASTITNVLIGLLILMVVSFRFSPIFNPLVTTTPGKVITPSPSVSSSPTVNASSPTVTALTSSPTSLPTIRENRTFPLTAGHNGFLTARSLTGTVTITASGVGQVSGKDLSDPFYIYTINNGQTVVTPYRVPGLTLCINDNPVDELMITPLPRYNDNHIYTFTIDAPGGQLKFGVCDTSNGLLDNSGFFTVTVSQ